MDVLWLTAGLGCDGDTIAMTAATQPSIEDLISGAIPGVPRMRLHNPVLSYENGERFSQGLASRGPRCDRPVHSRRRGLDPR